MRLKKDHIGLIRALPRHTEAGQRAALDALGVVEIIDLATTDPARVLDSIRRGDTIYLQHLHLLAERVRRTDHNPRADFFRWLVWLVNRGVILVDVAANERADTRNVGDLPALLKMIGCAVETITKHSRGRAIRIARKNGAMSKGRPRVDLSETRDAARALYFDASVAGKELERRLRRLNRSWTLGRCWKEFGPRWGSMPS